MADTATYLTRREAAAACGVSFDTIRRRIKAGMPAEEQDGVIVVAVADLVAHGLLDPLAAGGDITGAVAKDRTERQLEEAQHALAVAGARVVWLEARLAEYQDETKFLRGLVKTAAA